MVNWHIGDQLEFLCICFYSCMSMLIIMPNRVPSYCYLVKILNVMRYMHL